MTEQLILLNSWVGMGGLFMEISVAILILFYIYLKMNKGEATELIKPVLNLATKVYGSMEKAVLIKIFFLSLFSSALTLYYSEVLGVVPCALCWFGRIFMYGIVIISATALWSDRKGDKAPEVNGILKYIFNFSILGAIVSVYHHILQMTASATSVLPCPASGGDCAKRIIFEYGHITFPWLAAVLFALFLVLILCVKEINKNK